jgi:hypothetical protein
MTVGQLLAQDAVQLPTRYFVLYLEWTLDLIPKLWPIDHILREFRGRSPRYYRKLWIQRSAS